MPLRSSGARHGHRAALSWWPWGSTSPERRRNIAADPQAASDAANPSPPPRLELPQIGEPLESTSPTPFSNGTLSVAGWPEAAPPPATAAPLLPANRILVQWAAGSSAAERLAALRAVGGTVLSTIHTGLMQELGQGMVEVIQLPSGLSREQAIRAYGQRAGVELAEPDWVVGTQVVSNDPYYTTSSRLWGMYSSDNPTAAGGSGTTNSFGSQAEQAWNRGATGSSKVVVGVIDEGIDYTHPDLYLNIWLNPGEINKLSFFAQLTDSNGDGLITFRDLNDSRNSSFVSDVNLNGRIDAGDLLNDSRWEDGIDNDGNGYKDDLIGWDFVYNTNDPYRPAEGDNHGTHVSGTIGGIGGNGIGVAGVNWNVQLMSLKFLGPSGGYTSGAVSGVNYYANMTSRNGASARYVGTSNSWGGGGSSSTLATAITNGAKVGNLFVAAAGNSSANNDITASYPSNYSTKAALGWDAVVAVASITNTGSLSSFSSYGSTTVDLGAPGSAIYSTVAKGGYASYSGTSMATPHVSGTLAMLAAAYPSATPQQLLDALYGGATPTTSLSGKTVTGARLNADGSLQKLSATLGGGGSTQTTTPTYSLTASANAVNEGSSVVYTLTTTAVAAGTNLVWKLSGVGVDATDISGGLLQGTLTVGSNGLAQFSVTLLADQLTEGAESLSASVFSDGTSTTALATAAAVTVNDTSQTPSSTTSLILWGTTASDDLTGSRGGGSAADQISGVSSPSNNASDLGRGQIDTVSGGLGADRFLLADSRGTFYNDGNSKVSGTGDYLWVQDFNPSEDKLQLRNGSEYLVRNVSINGTAFTEIYLSNGDGVFKSSDELIARLEGQSLAPGTSIYVLVNQPWTTYA